MPALFSAGAAPLTGRRLTVDGLCAHFADDAAAMAARVSVGAPWRRVLFMWVAFPLAVHQARPH
jgi:hypothetical protein